MCAQQGARCKVQGASFYGLPVCSMLRFALIGKLRNYTEPGFSAWGLCHLDGRQELLKLNPQNSMK